MQDITFPTIAAMILLQLALAANVSRVRTQTKTLIGGSCDPADPLYKARVAHSNAAEFIPALSLTMLCLHLNGSAQAMQWACAGVLVARVLHAVGILLPKTLDKPHPFRLLGAAGSYALGGLLTIRLLLAGI